MLGAKRRRWLRHRDPPLGLEHCSNRSTLPGGQAGDPDVTVVMGRGDAEAVGVKVHVAGDVRQGEAVVVLVGAGFPEEQESAAGAAAGAHQACRRPGSAAARSRRR